MKLTIGMIVKNEEKYLERCLCSIKPILDKIDSELIITDTGSNDKTVDIAQKFTDNIIHFEWINDFATARNTAFEIAKGEWFMFIDADEIFVSCDEIIKFFNSGEYKRYNSASFVIRNLMPAMGDDTNLHYEDFNAPRLTRKLPVTRFVSEIHEALNTYGQPIKKLNSIAEHYGYLYDDEDAMRDKMMRNIGLLQKKLDSASDTELPRIYLQLFESYINFDEDNAYIYLGNGIAKAKETGSIMLIPLYCEKARDALAKGRYYTAVKTCDEYLYMDKQIRPNALTSDAEIYAVNASANYNLGNYDNAIDNYIKFFNTYNLIKANKLITDDAYMMSYSIACDRNFLPLLNEFLCSCEHIGRFGTASEYLKKLPIYKYSFLDAHADAIVGNIVCLLAQTEYKNAEQYYRQLSGYGKQKLRDTLYRNVFSEESVSNIASALDSIIINDEKFKDKLHICVRCLNGENVPEEVFCRFAEKYDFTDSPEIVMIVLKQNRDISVLVKNDNFDMKALIYNGYLNWFGFGDAVEMYDVDTVKDIDAIPKVILFYELCLELSSAYIAAGSGMLDLSLDRLFEVYAKLGRVYAENHYSIVRPLPSYIEGAVAAYEIVTARKDGRYKDCFASMKKAAAIHKGFTSIIDQYSKIVYSEYEAKLQNDPADELKRLSEMVKDNIRAMISAGDRDSALTMLSEYQKLNPGDAEAEELEKLINASDV